MKTVYYEDFEGLAIDLLDELEQDEDTVIAALHYADARELLTELIRFSNVHIWSLHLESPEWDNYEDEYYVTLTKESENGIVLNCEKAKHPDKDIYLLYEAKFVALAPEAHYEIVKRNCFQNARFVEAVIGEELYDADDDECEEDCDTPCCECCECGECGDDEHIHVHLNIDGDDVDVYLTLDQFLQIAITFPAIGDIRF